MRQTLLVGLGGGLGAIARFQVGRLVLRRLADTHFPVGTVLINVTGCLLAGVLAGLVEKHDALGGSTRLFLLVGVLGGYTTFSSFGLETILLLQRHEPGAAALNVAVSVAAGLAAVWLGLRLAS